MENKHLKIEIPEGYEIDKENSTFENIVFKSIKEAIKYNADYNGVEIECNGEHFVVLEMRYKTAMDWDDVIKYSKDRGIKIPTIKQLRIMHNYYDKINKLLKFSKIEGRLYWSSTQYDFNKAMGIHFGCNEECRSYKTNTNHVRFIVNL